MLNTIVIDDEKSATKDLITKLTQLDPDLQVLASLSSVNESLDYFSKFNHGDIIFSEVQLHDGLAFDIFDRLNIAVPVIFTTTYEKFTMNAFECNGIDYLLKPVEEDDLQKALMKYQKLKNHFSNHTTVTEQYNFNGRKKTRLVARKGMENISLRLDDIVLFYTDNKVVYVIDQEGKKYLADKPLGSITHELDESSFFRANRQYIININYVKGFKAHEKVKLLVELTNPGINHSVIVSQEKAPAFREWIYNA